MGLAIFDLDGTLLNTIADLGAACNYALEKAGYPTHQAEEYPQLVGNGVNKLIERALPPKARTEENVLRVREWFVPYYNEHNCDLTKPYEGIEEVLRILKDTGWQLAVASNKYQEATTKIIRYFFPNIPFVAVLGQREGKPIKPDPAIVHEIIGLAGVETAEVLYVGDSGVDMQTGANAGVETCGVTWGFRPRTELDTFAPQHIVDEAAEIIPLILPVTL